MAASREVSAGSALGRSDACPGRSIDRESKLILIHTMSNDFHGVICGHVLEGRGHHVVRWLSEEYPASASSSINFNDGKRGEVLDTPRGVVSSAEVDVVWYRRRRTPGAPDHLDPSDRDFAKSELGAAEFAHADGFERAFWINRRVAAGVSDIKANQLRVAQDVGLDIPPTLISNDPREIREFIGRFERTIYKPLSGYVWSEGGCVRKTYTAGVALCDLPEENLLRSTPGIFQKKIDKAFEVRAQFFGSTCLAVRIESGSLRDGDLDWRIDQRSIERCAPIDVPTSIQVACRELMTGLGLVSGGIDFIVTPGGSWFFLEINEAGQFLFIESWCAELRVLEAFCQFVESGGVDLDKSKRQQGIRLDWAVEAARADGLLGNRQCA